ncbi:Uncharacterised protein [Bordetella pertussis]|nr:Uncharacterised protein [Bordetella pertussis]
MSTKPGVTILPRASISAIRAPRTPMSATRGAPPCPSMSNPPRMTRSSACSSCISSSIELPCARLRWGRIRQCLPRRITPANPASDKQGFLMLRQGFPIHGAASRPFARPPAPPGPAIRRSPS